MTPEERELLTLKMQVKNFQKTEGWENSWYRRIFRFASFYFIILIFAEGQNIEDAPIAALIPALTLIVLEFLHPVVGRIFSRFVSFEK